MVSTAIELLWVGLRHTDAHFILDQEMNKLPEGQNLLDFI